MGIDDVTIGELYRLQQKTDKSVDDLMLFLRQQTGRLATAERDLSVLEERVRAVRREARTDAKKWSGTISAIVSGLISGLTSIFR